MEINLQSFLLVSAMMAIVIAFLFIINTLFTKKISAKIRYFMWVVIMVGLLIPFRPAIGDGVIDISNFTTTTTEMVDAMPESSSVVPIEAPATTLAALDQSVVENEQIPIKTIVMVTWMTVAIGIVGYHLFQYIRFQRAIKRWGEPEEDADSLAIFDCIKQEMGLGNCKVELVVCGFISTSMLTGFLKPIILLPERNYDNDELALIFRHELIHYRRKDLWIKLLSVIAVAIHWFNPLVYLMNIALQTEGEASCDQEVLEVSKLKSRHFYAEVIIGMIGGKKSGMTMLATNFYTGKKGIKKRLEEVMVVATPRRSASYAFLALIVLLTIASGSVFAMSDNSQGNIEQGWIGMPTMSNDDSFEIAIAAVGGGAVMEYHQLSDELLLVYIEYGNDVYIVEIDTNHNRVSGLSTYRDERNGVEVDAVEEPIEIGTELLQEESDTQPISNDRAIEIATTHLVNEGFSSATFLEVDMGFEYGRQVWEVAFRYRSGEIEFYIDVTDGSILKFEVDID